MAGDVRFDQRLGSRLSPELSFRDEGGRGVHLGDYLGRRPVILAPVYYRCPFLCNQVLNGLVRTLKAVSLDAGSGFDVVAVSISPDETPELAGREKALTWNATTGTVRGGVGISWWATWERSTTSAGPSASGIV